jgi:fatty-acyl-CoA synthase
MIVRGGENVYPREIEEFLMTHEDIESVQVTGVPDEKFGEEIIAWIGLKKDASLNEEQLKEFCHGKIAHYKVPRYVRFGHDFPMTVTGKIQKYKMREVSIKELGLTEIVTA